MGGLVGRERCDPGVARLTVQRNHPTVRDVLPLRPHARGGRARAGGRSRGRARRPRRGSGRPQRFAFRVRQDDGRGAVRCPGRIGQSRRADLPTVACLGVGGGTLPLFLANRGYSVVGVDIDPVVLEAARSSMGLAGHIHGLTLIEAPAEAYLTQATSGSLSAAVVDLFDGNDAVLAALADPDGALLCGLAHALDPECGVTLVNLHCPPSRSWSLLSPRGGGFDAESPQGRFVKDVTRAMRAAGLTGEDGCCFALKAQSQHNVCLVAMRGIGLTPASADLVLQVGLEREMAERGQLGFDGKMRVTKGLTLL